jgi:3-dehydroquinate synthase
LLDEKSSEQILKLLEQLGFDLFADELLNTDANGQLSVLAGLEEFREHLGGELSITLPREIGCGVEVHEMNQPKIIEAIQQLRKRK